MDEGGIPTISSTPVPPNGNTLEERRFAQESAAKRRELDLREREVAVREREMASRWLSPIVLGLFATALGLAANVVIALLNNKNTLEVERRRSQSSLLLEAIKTGSTDDTCKNLVFFVELGLVNDINQTIRKECESAPKGVPSLPVAHSGLGPNGVTLDWRATGYVYDADTGSPIADAKVTVPVLQGPPMQTDSTGSFTIPISRLTLANGGKLEATVEKTGYQTTTLRLNSLGLNFILMHRAK